MQAATTTTTTTFTATSHSKWRSDRNNSTERHQWKKMGEGVNQARGIWGHISGVQERGWGQCGKTRVWAQASCILVEACSIFVVLPLSALLKKKGLTACVRLWARGGARGVFLVTLFFFRFLFSFLFGVW